MPPSDRPVRLTDRTSFTLSLAILVGLISGALGAGAMWNGSRATDADHEVRIKRNEQKLEDIATIKTDLAVMKAILERIERRQRSSPPE